MARAPESDRNHVEGCASTVPPRVERWDLGTSEVCFNAIHQAQSRRVPNCGARPALDEPECCAPLPERYRIIQCSATGNTRAGRFYIGARIKQSIQYCHVIAAGSPVEGGLVSFRRVQEHDWRARIPTGSGDYGYAPGTVWEVPRPIGRFVQQRTSRPLGINDSRSCQIWILDKQALQHLDLARVDRLNNLDYQWIFRLKVRHNQRLGTAK